MLEGSFPEITEVAAILPSVAAYAQSQEALWIIFDMDLTLIQANCPHVYYDNIARRQSVYNSAIADLSPGDLPFLNYGAMYQTPQIPVEPAAISIIRDLQTKYKTFVLTSSLTGRFTDGPRVEKWRYDALRELGLDFSGAFKPLCEVALTDEIVFYKGVLSGNKKGKNYALELFLQKLGSGPKAIILVDDRMKNLRAVSAWAKSKDIEFFGFHYLRARPISDRATNDKDFFDFWRTVSIRIKGSSRC